MTETTTEKVSAVLAVFNQLGMLPFITLVPCLMQKISESLCYLNLHKR